MKYYYKAVKANGERKDGILEARDSKEVVSILRSQQLIPVKIIEQKSSSILLFGKKNSFTQKELIFFTRQMSTMLNSGLTLMQSLRILDEQITRPSAHEIIAQIISDIESGSTFSDAIKKHPNVFSNVYVSLIQASESSGLIDKIMLQMAENLEKSYKLKAQIKSAFFYPVIVILLMVVVAAVMVFFVIPQISTLYTSLDVEMPLPTKILLGISNVMIFAWPIVLGVVVFGLFLFRRWHKTKSGKYSVDLFLLKMPLFGKLVKNSVLTEFSRTLGLLISSGAEIVQAMSQVSEVVGNSLYRNDIETIARRVEKGVPVGDSMSASNLFPSYLVQMVRVGEQTGKLDESLLRSSEYFEGEVEQSVKTLTTAMEPAIMIILGIGVGFLLISVITPIYKITSSF